MRKSPKKKNLPSEGYPNPFDDLEGWMKQFDLFEREQKREQKAPK